jgi:hypothetical protein
MKLPILWAAAHHAVAAARIARPARYNGRRPIVSDTRPNSGWREVDVSRKDVDNHDAEFDALK